VTESAAARPTAWLVRHGATEWATAGRHTGWTDIPLTDDGRAQAEALRERLLGVAFDRVVSSPLSRALETCRIALPANQPEIEPDLVEWDYGDYEGLTTPEIRASVPSWTPWSHPMPGGETIDAVAARTDRLIADLLTTTGRTAVFAHGHLLRIFAARWLGVDPRVGANLLLGTATVSILGWDRDNPAIVRWNDPGGALVDGSVADSGAERAR
jgi:probable phosphoglycerate mutase